MISEATEKDWEDFWNSEDVINSYSEYINDEGLLKDSEENLKFIDNVRHSCQDVHTYKEIANDSTKERRIESK